MNCKKCGRQLKHPSSLIRGMGRTCAGENDHVTHWRRKKPGNAKQPELFVDTPTIMRYADDGDVIDFDWLRGMR